MIAFLLAAALQAAEPASIADVTRLSVATPQVVLEVESGKLKGEPTRLAWSPDGTELYLMAAQKDRSGAVTLRHFVISISKKELKGLDGEPPWASAYWQWKSGQAAPGALAFKIDIDTKQESRRATNSPMGGDLARGGADTGGMGGTSVSDANAAALNSQAATVISLRLKGEPLGEWTNEAVTPGTTFGWAPKGSRAIAFVTGKDGALALMDETKHKTTVAGTKNSMLPAWSDSGTRLVWLERRGKKFAVVTADLSLQP